MKSLASAIFAALLPLAPMPPAAAHEVPDPAITHNAPTRSRYRTCRA